MWWLGLIIAGIVIVACILYALAKVAGQCDHDDDYWMGY